MKLYHSPTSPYVRKVMLTLHLTGQLGDVELIPGSGTPLASNPETLKANPLGKVPCLVTDAGDAIYDSRVICRYLDWRGKGGLYPEGADLFPVLTAEALADGIIDAGLLGVYEWRLRPEDKRFQPYVDGQVGKITRGLDVMEQAAVVLDGPVNAAKVAAGACLGYMDFRYPQLNWRDTRPKLAAWFEGFAATSAMQVTAIPADA